MSTLLNNVAVLEEQTAIVLEFMRSRSGYVSMIAFLIIAQLLGVSLFFEQMFSAKIGDTIANPILRTVAGIAAGALVGLVVESLSFFLAVSRATWLSWLFAVISAALSFTSYYKVFDTNANTMFLLGVVIMSVTPALGIAILSHKLANINGTFKGLNDVMREISEYKTHPETVNYEF